MTPRRFEPVGFTSSGLGSTVDGLDHGFGGISGVFFNPRSRPNPEHVAWKKNVTLAFWEAYLKQNDAARAWLQSSGLAKLSRGAATIVHK